jgi:short-subunit dehydrogenase
MPRIAIFGATSAIAAEVAAIHAARGDRLQLVARSRDKLEALATRLAGAQPGTTCADLSDTRASERLVAGVAEQLGGIDVALIAHGVLGDQLKSEREIAEAEQIILANFTSAVALLIPLANYFEAARRGRLGVITSVAGERGRPRNYTYGASKAGLTVYLQGLRSRLRPASVAVTNFKLGPVDTPMTASHRKNLLFARPAAVARQIVAAMDARAGEVFLPRRWAAIMPIVRHTPEALFQRLSFLSGR